jgi:hypothetical protein
LLHIYAFIEKNSMVKGIFERHLKFHCPPQLKVLNSAASLRLRALTQQPSLRARWRTLVVKNRALQLQAYKSSPTSKANTI